MTDQPTPEDTIFDEAFAPDDFPTEGEFGLDSPGALAGMGDTAADELREQFEAARAGWYIDGENTAAWAAHRLRRAQARAAEAEEAARKLAEAAVSYYEKVKARTDHDSSFFTSKLREWYDRVGGEGKTKTRAVIGATLTEKVGSVSTSITEDEDELRALLDWLENNRPEAIDYKDPTVKKAALADLQGKVDKTQPGQYPAVDETTGELVPGVTFVRGEPRFTVTLTDLDAPTDE